MGTRRRIKSNAIGQGIEKSNKKKETTHVRHGFKRLGYKGQMDAIKTTRKDTNPDRSH